MYGSRETYTVFIGIWGINGDLHDFQKLNTCEKLSKVNDFNSKTIIDDHLAPRLTLKERISNDYTPCK